MQSDLEIVRRRSQQAPVDLTGMFKDLGIRYREIPIQSGESGWIELDNEDFSVVVNSRDALARRRFTAAHELAHYLLHRDLMMDGNRMNRHTDRLWDGTGGSNDSPINRQHEVQANQWAARIIMPADLVRRKHSKNPDSAWLASEFKVSKAAMDIRLKTLGLV